MAGHSFQPPLLYCRQREAQGAKLRKAAEKLLLAHLKKRALDTLQAEQALEAAKSPPSKRSKKNPPAITSEVTEVCPLYCSQGCKVNFRQGECNFACAKEFTGPSTKNRAKMPHIRQTSAATSFEERHSKSGLDMQANIL